MAGTAKVRTCKNCQSEFKSTNDKKIYCCHTCASRSCAKVTSRLRYKLNPDYERERGLLRHYGITIDDYNKMFEEQGGRCKICDSHQTEFKRRLSVDHCHTTKRVRGLLCHNCNLAIGRLKEDPEVMANAIRYLTDGR